MSTDRPRRRGGSRWYVAVLPGQHTPERAERLAAVTGTQRFDADQTLRHPLPWVVEFASPAEASAYGDKLDAAGVARVLFDQQALDAIPDPTPVRCLQMPEAAPSGPYRAGPAALTVALVDGRQLQIQVAEWKLAVFATLEHRELREVMKMEQVEFRGGHGPRITYETNRTHDDRLILDLYGEAEPLRIREPLSEIRGFGLSRLENRASFLRLRKWLDACTGLTILEGLPSSARRSGTGAVTRDDGALWNVWSAQAWLIYQ